MTHTFAHGYALLVGVNENQVARWALPDVVKDIDALAQVLAHPLRCAYPAEHVKTIMGKEATRQGILDGLEWLQTCVQKDAGGNATAVIYYSGHGWRDAAAGGAAYLIPYDVREASIPSRALRAADLAAEVEALRPRRLLVALDCCHAGALGVKGALPPAGYAAAAIAPALLMAGEQAAVGPGAKGPASPDYSLELLAVGQGRAVLSSSTGEQSSYLRADQTMSIFTYHLIEALTGHAEPKEGATEVLVSDVMGHVHRRVPPSAQADWGQAQTPDYQVSGNFPVALLLGGKGLSKGQPAPDPLAPLGDEPVVHRVIHTGGGDYVEGDKFGGDKVAGDKITIDASTHDRHDVHIKAGRDIAYATEGGITTVGDGNISVGGGVGGPIIVAREGSTVNLGGTQPGPPPATLPPAALRVPPSEYNLAVVRSLVTIALDDSDLVGLASDYFPAAYESFGRGMGKTEKVQVLLDYCERHGRTGELLELVQARNPGRYAEYAPRLRRVS